MLVCSSAAHIYSDKSADGAVSDQDKLQMTYFGGQGEQTMHAITVFAKAAV